MTQIGRVRTVTTGVAGAPYYTNMHFRGIDSVATAQGAVDAVEAFWGSLISLMDVNLIQEIEAEVPVFDDTDGVTTAVFTTTGGASNPGASGDILPPANQLLVRWTTAGFVSGRRVRGRNFLPGFREADSTNGKPDGSLVTSVGAVAATLAASGPHNLCIWSRPVDADPGPARAGSSHIVLGSSVWSEWAILRSRRD